jgi:hypothetical protein
MSVPVAGWLTEKWAHDMYQTAEDCWKSIQENGWTFVNPAAPREHDAFVGWFVSRCAVRKSAEWIRARAVNREIIEDGAARAALKEAADALESVAGLDKAAIRYRNVGEMIDDLCDADD